MAPAGARREGACMSCIEHSAPLPGLRLRLRLDAASALVPRRVLPPAAAIALAALVAGVGIAGAAGPLAAARLPILSGAGGLLLFALVFHDRVGALLRRLAPALTERLAVSRRALAALGLYAVGNWLFDCVCLYVSLR